MIIKQIQTFTITPGLVPLVVWDKMLWWKDESSGEVLGRSGCWQAISEAMIDSLGRFFFNLEKYLGIRARNTHLIWLTSICRWLNKYLDIYDKWYHRKWDGTGSKKSREKYGKLCSSEQKPEILSQIIYCTNIFGPCKACNAVPIITNNMNFNQPWITQEPGPPQDWICKSKTKHFAPRYFLPQILREEEHQQNIIYFHLSQGLARAA